MIEILEQNFSFDLVEITKLNGYENENFQVKTESGKYIFKTYNYSEETLALVEAENQTLFFLQKEVNKSYPKPIVFIDGSYVKIIDIKGKKSICRMLSYLEGESMDSVAPSEKLFQSFGAFLAAMDLKLQKFNNYTIKAKHWEWGIQYLHLNDKYIQDIDNARDRSTVKYFFQQFDENVAPVLPDLRNSIIHNDANEWNVMVSNGEISGIIDFGDLAYSPLINELAVAISYACFKMKDLLEGTSTILTSYHKILPIEEKELTVLYYMIAARLCISVCNSAHSRKEYPHNEYAYVSEKPAWNILYRLLSINPLAAENSFRSALGFPLRKPIVVEKAMERRHNSISPIFSVSYKKPVYMVGSAFQYMYDAYGNTYLDAYNNIPHVGHSHPKVVEAGQKQMAKLNTNTRYLYDLLPEYAEKLLSKFPPSLSKVYFVNSGSEASDLAIRMARKHTNYKNLMVVEHGYHGNTQAAIDISDYKFSHSKGQGRKDYILTTPIPDTYRGKYTKNDGSAGKMYAKEAIEQIECSVDRIAAFISEPIIGCGGQVPLAKGYLKELYPAIRKQGGICISDEVQTGFGRLGDYFWGFEEQEVVPDMVIIGKPMANGHPMGAVITTSERAGSFAKGVEFFSSFGGNPVSCAIGMAVLEVIEEEKLQQNAKSTGDYYKSLFIELKKKYKCIGDVRGSGLFLGIEIISDDDMAPNTELAQFIKNELRAENILISTDGPYDNVLKTKPPLIFNQENAKKVVANIDEILARYYHNK
jgi:4-aminobutyrate aminotransferase-like enzyme/Ser/Thr protein kinase RdoA (MazF antagonist)